MLGNGFVSNPSDLDEILSQIAIVIPSKIFKSPWITRGARDHDRFIGILRYMANDDVFTVSNDFPLTRTKNVLNEIADVFVAGYVGHAATWIKSDAHNILLIREFYVRTN